METPTDPWALVIRMVTPGLELVLLVPLGIPQTQVDQIEGCKDTLEDPKGCLELPRDTLDIPILPGRRVWGIRACSSHHSSPCRCLRGWQVQGCTHSRGIHSQGGLCLDIIPTMSREHLRMVPNQLPITDQVTQGVQILEAWLVGHIPTPLLKTFPKVILVK